MLNIIANKMDEICSDYGNFDCSYLYIKDLSEKDQETQNIGMEENMGRINVWLVSEEDMGEMLVKILKPEDLEYTFTIIMPDLEQPWDIMNQCEKWMSVLKSAIFKITPNLDFKQLERLRERIVNVCKTYEEPEFDKDGKLINKKIRLNKNQQNNDSMDDSQPKIEDIDVSLMEEQEMMEDLRKEIELPEGVLVTNLFIPCAVICSKVDLIEHGEKDIKIMLERNIDYIQVTLRKFCMHYGASLVFASSNSNTNIE